MLIQIGYLDFGTDPSLCSWHTTIGIPEKYSAASAIFSLFCNVFQRNSLLPYAATTYPPKSRSNSSRNLPPLNCCPPCSVCTGSLHGSSQRRLANVTLVARVQSIAMQRILFSNPPKWFCNSYSQPLSNEPSLLLCWSWMRTDPQGWEEFELLDTPLAFDRFPSESHPCLGETGGSELWEWTPCATEIEQSTKSCGRERNIPFVSIPISWCQKRHWCSLGIVVQHFRFLRTVTEPIDNSFLCTAE